MSAIVCQTNSHLLHPTYIHLFQQQASLPAGKYWFPKPMVRCFPDVTLVRDSCFTSQVAILLMCVLFWFLQWTDGPCPFNYTSGIGSLGCWPFHPASQLPLPCQLSLRANLYNTFECHCEKMGVNCLSMILTKCWLCTSNEPLASRREIGIYRCDPVRAQQFDLWHETAEATGSFISQRCEHSAAVICSRFSECEIAEWVYFTGLEPTKDSSAELWKINIQLCKMTKRDIIPAFLWWWITRQQIVELWCPCLCRDVEEAAVVRDGQPNWLFLGHACCAVNRMFSWQKRCDIVVVEALWEWMPCIFQSLRKFETLNVTEMAPTQIILVNLFACELGVWWRRPHALKSFPARKLKCRKRNLILFTRRNCGYILPKRKTQEVWNIFTPACTGGRENSECANMINSCPDCAKSL